MDMRAQQVGEPARAVYEVLAVVEDGVSPCRATDRQPIGSTVSEGRVRTPMEEATTRRDRLRRGSGEVRRNHGHRIVVQNVLRDIDVQPRLADTRRAGDRDHATPRSATARRRRSASRPTNDVSCAGDCQWHSGTNRDRFGRGIEAQTTKGLRPCDKSSAATARSSARSSVPGARPNSESKLLARLVRPQWPLPSARPVQSQHEQAQRRSRSVFRKPICKHRQLLAMLAAASSAPQTPR